MEKTNITSSITLDIISSCEVLPQVLTKFTVKLITLPRILLGEVNSKSGITSRKRSYAVSSYYAFVVLSFKRNFTHFFSV